MTTVYEIPLSGVPETFSVTLSGTEYSIRVYWCTASSTWILDISTSKNVPVLLGLPLVPGNNLLAPFTYLGIPGRLEVQTDRDVFAPPTYTNLGTDAHLYYIVE